MIIRSRGQDYERRLSADSSFLGFGVSGAESFPGAGLPSLAGMAVSVNTALGLPAVASAIRLVSETIASLTLNVFTGRRAQKRLADSSPQAALLHRPNDECSSFDFISDIAASIEASGNAFILKAVGARGQLAAMYVLNPAFVHVWIDPRTGDKRIQYTASSQYGDIGSSRTLDLSENNVIHIRGFTPGGWRIGLSPIALHRQKLGSMIAQDQWAGRFFSQGATPTGAIKVPGDLTQSEVDDLIDKWSRRHQGANQWHRPAVLVNGADWVATGLSLRDSQFIEGQQLTVQQVAQMWRVPASLLEAQGTRGETHTAEQEFMRFHLGLLPRLRRIEQGLAFDSMLFGGVDPYPEFAAGELLRADAVSHAEVQLRQVQSGQRVPDELRADDGLPPLDEINPDLPKNIGKIPQVVPVGGSPFGVPHPGGADGGPTQPDPNAAPQQ